MADTALALTEGWLREQSCNHHYAPVPAKPCLGAKLGDQAHDLGSFKRIIGQQAWLQRKPFRQKGAARASWSAVARHSKRRAADSLAPSTSLWTLDLDPH